MIVLLSASGKPPPTVGRVGAPCPLVGGASARRKSRGMSSPSGPGLIALWLCALGMAACSGTSGPASDGLDGRRSQAVDELRAIEAARLDVGAERLPLAVA